MSIVGATAAEGDAAGYETFTANLANTSLYAPVTQGTVNIIDNNTLNLSVGDTFIQDTPSRSPP